MDEITKPCPEGKISEHISQHPISILFWPTYDIPQVWGQECCVNVLFRAENFTDTNFLHLRSSVLNKNRVSCLAQPGSLPFHWDQVASELLRSSLVSAYSILGLQVPALTLDFYLYMGPRHWNSGLCTAMVISPELSPQLQYLLLVRECFRESKHSAHNCELFTFTLLPQK